jgi:hypothetical protein
MHITAGCAERKNTSVTAVISRAMSGFAAPREDEPVMSEKVVGRRVSG